MTYVYETISSNLNVRAHYSAFSIKDFLSNNSNGVCVLIIQPHEHACFLYALTRKFKKANIKIVANKLFLSDSVILNTLGFTDIDTFDSFAHGRSDMLLMVKTSKFHPLPNWKGSFFLTFINNRIFHKLSELGVTEKQREILSCILKGESNSTIGYRLNISSKTVSSHKKEALKKLPHGLHRFAIIKGLQALHPKKSTY